MNGIKKPFLVALSFILVLMISACGAKDSGNEPSNGNVDSASGNGASQPSGGNAGPVTITFWHHYSTASPEEKTLLEVLIPKFESEHPDIRVKAISYPWADLHQKLQLVGSVGESPDVARLDIIWVPEFQERGMLTALDETFEDFDEIAGQLLEGPVSTGKIGGKHYALPLNTNTKVLFWNQSMFEESGLSGPPATMDEFFEVVNALKTREGTSWAFGEPALQGWNILPWIWSNGGDVLSEDFSTADGYLNGPASVEILGRLKEAFSKGKISGFRPGDAAVSEGHAQGQYAMIVEGPWTVAQFKGQFSDFAVNMAPFPAGKAGSVQVLGGEDIGIFSKDKKEQSWEFVKFMVSEFAQIEMGKAGQIPVNKAAMEHPDIKAVDYYGPFLDQLRTAKARPPAAAWPKIDLVLNDAMFEIFLTDGDIKTILDKAVEQIDQLLTQSN